MGTRKIKLGEQVQENENAFLRSFILGNAGGTIATLSLIGTIIGSSDDHKFDSGSFYVLILFLIGLGCGAFTRFATAKWATFEKGFMEKEGSDKEASAKKRDKWEQIYFYTYWSSGGALALGVVIGLFHLWCFTK